MATLKTKSSSPNAPPADPAVSTTPWLRRRGESAKAYAAAHVYFKMRDQQSLEEVAWTLQKDRSLIALRKNLTAAILKLGGII